MSAAKNEGVTATAPLLYWLVVIAGLVGFSLLRLLSPELETYEAMSEIGPIWVGTLAGLAVGQLFAFLRIRAWVPMTILLVGAVGPGIWAFSMLYYYLDHADRAVLEAGLVAFAPAAISGYLALSERGALAAFWYPTTLWMVVILDGQSAAAVGSFDRRAALPLVVGLGALFVAFLRARETRRAALWRVHGGERIAEARPRTVLRTTPLRSTGEHLGVGLVVGGALILAGWIAPHLWQVEKLDRSTPSAAALASHGAAPHHGSASPPCCNAAGLAPKKVARISEYFPLTSAKQESEELAAQASCVTCSDDAVAADKRGLSYSSGEPAYYADGSGTYDYGGGYYGGGGGYYGGGAYASPPPAPAPPPANDLWTMPDPQPVAPEPPVAPPSVVKVQPPPAPPVVPAPLAQPKAATPTTTPTTPPAVGPASTSAPVPAAATQPTAAPPPPPPSAPLDVPGTPWRGTLVICAAAMALHVIGRAIRRALVLRHLASPFWSETVDQRISNHWHRVLIALRDAGVAPTRDELPTAFARRVGIAGMETCASILERVRHGVGIEPLDLQAMADAASSVSTAARRRAGAVARALSWLRSPTA